MLRCACVALMPLLFACSEAPSGSSSDASTDARLADLDIEADARVDGKGEVDAGPDASAPDVTLPDDCADPSAFQTDGSFASITEAIRQAEQAGGGVVCIPAGDFDWGAVKEFLMAGGVSLIGAGEEHSTIRWDGNQLFVVNKPGDQPGPLRVSGLTFHRCLSITNGPTPPKGYGLAANEALPRPLPP